MANTTQLQSSGNGPVFASGGALPDISAYLPAPNAPASGANAKPWFTIKNAVQGLAEPAAQEVLIYGDIGQSWYGDTVVGADFVKAFAAIEAKNIIVRINSLGGSVSDGITIFNAIVRHPATVTVIVDGLACSVASLIAMAGNTLQMADNALMMIHAPWGGTVGNSNAMREYADMLDKWAEAMATCYVQKTGKTTADVLAWLTDGKDHWLTAADALAGGWIDSIVAPAQADAAAAYRDQAQARFPSFPGALAAPIPQPVTLPPQANAALPGSPDRATILAAEQVRREQVIATFAPHIKIAGVAELEAACLADFNMTPDAAGLKLLAQIAKGVAPVAGASPIVTLEDERDKFRTGMQSAIMARANIGPDDPKNNFRSMTMREFARECLVAAGVNTRQLDIVRLVSAAFTHTSSDFGNILTGIIEKAMMKGFDETGETFHLWTNKGILTDYKPGRRLDLNNFPSLDKVEEAAEYLYATVGDRGETVQLGKYGKRFALTREAIINDDLDFFGKLPKKFGAAAKRTVGNLVYGVLTANPAMADGKALFHADHKNIDTDASISSASVDSMGVLMGVQTIGEEAGLNIPLKTLLVPLTLRGRAEAVRISQYEVGGASAASTAPNTVANTFTVVADSRLDKASKATWYGVADQNQFDTIEVSYLDGIEVPMLETMNGWSVDGVEYKIRLDVAVKALEHRTFVRNAGK